VEHSPQLKKLTSPAEGGIFLRRKEMIGLEVRLSPSQLELLRTVLRQLGSRISSDFGCFTALFPHNCPKSGETIEADLVIRLGQKEEGPFAKSLGAQCPDCGGFDVALHELLEAVGKTQEARIMRFTEELEEEGRKAEQAEGVNTILFNGRTEGITNPGST
jgi:hypothetical protein